MFLFNEILSIDYGTSYIKGILFKKIPGELTILQSNLMEIIPVKDGNEYEYNLNRFLNSFFPNAKYCIINIPIENTFVRDLDLPVTSVKILKEIIPFEVESVVPFPIENLEIMFNVWKINTESSNLITFNAHHNELNRTLNPFIEKKLNPKILSVDSYALASLLKKIDIDAKLLADKKDSTKDSVLSQLDIGGKKTIFNVSVGGKLCFSRYFTLGGETITARIAKFLKISEKKAEELKISINFNILDTEEDKESKKEFQKHFNLTINQLNSVFKIVLKVLEEIAEEAIRSIYSLTQGIAPEVIYLSGGSSYFDICEKYFSAKIGIETKRYNFKEIKDEEYIQCYANIQHYNLPAGDRIDFLKTDYAKKINIYSFNFKYFKPHLILAGIAFVILIFVFITGFLADRKKIQANEIILAKKYEVGFNKKLPEDMSAMDAANLEVKKELKNTEIYRQFLNKPNVLDVIYEITNNFPSKDATDFQLDQMIYDNDEVTIYGRVNEFADVGVIQDNLQRSQLFKNITVVNKNLLSGSKTFKVKFQLKLEIKDNSGENE